MKTLIILFPAVMMLTACGQDKENDQGAIYVNITAEEAKQIMDSEEGYISLHDMNVGFEEANRIICFTKKL